jgi:hypothetical protein
MGKGENLERKHGKRRPGASKLRKLKKEKTEKNK